jgi:salicylate hydroxylase
MRILQRLGVADSITRRAAPVNEWWIFAPDGSVLSHQVAGRDGPISSLAMYRPDLVAALAAGLPDGVLHTGHRCVAFSQDDRSAVVTFDNGESVEADVVVAADGIHSTLQRYVVEPRRPVFSGVVAYRGVMPAARVPDWSWPQALVSWAGQGKHFLVFPVRAGTLLNYVGFVPADEQMRESWSAPGDPAVLAAEFADWDPRLSRLLSQVDATLRWGLYDRDPLPRWTHGRLTLLGDAAHPMLPHMGQGANQAIEDGMALATLMRDTDAGDVTDVLICGTTTPLESSKDPGPTACEWTPGRRLISVNPVYRTTTWRPRPGPSGDGLDDQKGSRARPREAVTDTVGHLIEVIGG